MPVPDTLSFAPVAAGVPDDLVLEFAPVAPDVTDGLVLDFPPVGDLPPVRPGGWGAPAADPDGYPLDACSDEFPVDAPHEDGDMGAQDWPVDDPGDDDFPVDAPPDWD